MEEVERGGGVGGYGAAGPKMGGERVGERADGRVRGVERFWRRGRHGERGPRQRAALIACGERDGSTCVKAWGRRQLVTSEGCVCLLP